jgi:protein involved in polysaccharide export with SLBB domain
LLRVALKPHIFNSVPAAPVQVEQLVFIIDLQKELSGVQRTELEKGDILRIFHLSELQIAPQVEIKGEVKKPGKYPLRANQKLSGLLAQAILTGRSHELKGEIARKTDGKTELLPFDVEAVMTGDVSQNLLLQNQDVISIFGEPESARLNSIQLSGEVRFPGTYIFKPQEKLSDLIKRAGGLTEKAWLPGARFFRQRVRRQHEELRRNFVERERRKLGAFKEAAGDVDADKGADRALAVKDLENVEEAMRALESFELNGRINLDLSQMNSVADLTGTESDLLLEDGDAFQVVQKPVEVVVYGQVMSPGTILFRENFSFADYIELVGGYADNANRSKVFILRANGDSLNISTLRRRGSGRRYVRNVRESEEAVTGILPGDTIIVPARIKSSRNHFAETLDSIYKMAISVGALGALF